MMKKSFILVFICLVISAMAFSQVPHTISYQAVVRAGNGELMRNKSITMRVNIIQGSMYGESIYTEMHHPNTNENGYVIVEIGGGETNDDFSALDWSRGSYFMQVEIDPNGGVNYSIESVNQILAVPYAFYAEKAGNVPDMSGFLTEGSAISALENDANYIPADSIPAESQTLADVAALGNSVNAQIKDLVAPTDAQDAVTKAYIDSIVSQLQMNSVFTEPTVETLDASGISGNYATFNGSTIADGGRLVSSRGFKYGTGIEELTSDIAVPGRGVGDFSIMVSDLFDMTTYYYMAYAVNSVDTAFGSVVSFTTTNITSPAVETLPVSNITYTSAVLNGNVTSDGNVTLSERGFIYGTSSDNLYYSVIASGAATGNYSYTLVGLTQGTTYYYKAYATNSIGTSYSDLASFETTAAAAPTVETSSASIVSLSATFYGSVTSENGAEVTERGFVYGTTSDNLNQTVVASGTGTGSFSYQVSDLVAGLTYYYKAYATNSEGTEYGSMYNFTLSGAVGTPGTAAGIFVDDRDGNTYALVTIGSQTWMAENLRYEGNIPLSVGNQASETVAYRYYPNGDEANVNIYGYLYNWPAAMNGANDSESNPSGVQGICPDGWHLPSKSEWEQLEVALGGENIAGAQLAGQYELWGTGNLIESAYFGTSGFMAVPAGAFSSNIYDWGVDGGNIVNFGSSCHFLSCTIDEGVDSGYLNSIGVASTNFENSFFHKSYGNSVRCVKNEGGSAGIVTATIPSVETGGYSIVSLTAVINGIVFLEKGAEVTERGFVYGTSPDNLEQIVVAAGTGVGTFSSQITGLLAGVTYYYKAYATNSAGTAYGRINNFTIEGVVGTPGVAGETLTDSRDGNTYATITIGGQTWMAENLRYEGDIPYATENQVSETVAYRYYPNNDAANVPSYGYLYNWVAAMYGASGSDANPSGVQGICPNGWHLPSSAEWDQLITALGGSTYAGSQLAGQSDLWTTGVLTMSEYFGTSGFVAIPAGLKMYEGTYGGFGNSVYFWTSTNSLSNNTQAYYYFVNSSSAGFSNNYQSIEYGTSIRCVRDN